MMIQVFASTGMYGKEEDELEQSAHGKEFQIQNISISWHWCTNHHVQVPITTSTTTNAVNLLSK